MQCLQSASWRSASRRPATSMSSRSCGGPSRPRCRRTAHRPRRRRPSWRRSVRSSSPASPSWPRTTAARSASRSCVGRARGSGELTDLYVVPERRGNGVADRARPRGRRLARRPWRRVPRPRGHVLERRARTVYQRWGFARGPRRARRSRRPRSQERLAPGRHATSFASLHVQTDAVAGVERAAREFAPRIRSRGTRVVGPRNGWVTVYDAGRRQRPERACSASRVSSRRAWAPS